MSLPVEFSSTSVFRDAFRLGLESMLARHDSLGVYILALANAAWDAGLWESLRARLEERHHSLADSISAALRQGARLTDTEDDLSVFLKLMAIGFARIGTVVQRHAGPWEVQFNPIRALRPPRSSGLPVENLRRPFDAEGFHFNKPFLRKEVLWEGELAGKSAYMLYNKFPFADLHGLLVPEPEHNHAQWLTPSMLDWAWETTHNLGMAMPGFCLAYNSYGAYASVNHLHFQSFVRESPLPLQGNGFNHHGGNTPYPLPCQVHDDRESAWFALDELHLNNTPYNLIFTADRLHIIARAGQGSRPAPSWSAGFAWSEMAGIMTVFCRDDFDRLDETEITSALSRLRP